MQGTCPIPGSSCSGLMCCGPRGRPHSPEEALERVSGQQGSPVWGRLVEKGWQNDRARLPAHQTLGLLKRGLCRL